MFGQRLSIICPALAYPPQKKTPPMPTTEGPTPLGAPTHRPTARCLYPCDRPWQHDPCVRVFVTGNVSVDGCVLFAAVVVVPLSWHPFCLFLCRFVSCCRCCVPLSLPPVCLCVVVVVCLCICFYLLFV